ncbi:enoyl-[acyl-carrier-protein] reductase FabK [Sporanaerobium hydrogeniformans]|uniref:Enoyl-[acyl-carrier-protein] reductase FabK n=1 Tax=Sporanaerobium hydrogeniformans TaxID=3072179 RepID=A0AC61DCG6_9FIRM|nr:enoyl-[acyl-carrier-protein] reductase FabK [Sporanaerobium hydrogeniformans]PHV70418.1 enoyl-[acyl-carrier-protein] reductase FabK [Sporanaerobium hydrogeniformans]
MNSIVDMLGIKYPIFQGGMAWIATHTIAAAVSNAGGLGIIAAGNAPCDLVREEIRACKKLTDKPFGVNVMLLSPYADEVATMIAEEGIAVVTTGAGNPGKYMELWKSKGIKVIPVVPSVALAKRMEKAGADALIAEGMESGGHIGELTTMALVPQIVDAVNIPVIAAGGIGDGRGFAAVLMLGAQGIQLGTRFLVAKECSVHEAYKARIIKATDIETVVTGRTTGHPVRCLRNQLTRQFTKLEQSGAPVAELEALGAGGLRRAALEGDVLGGTVMSGQIAGLIKKEQTASEIIEELVTEMKAIITNQQVNI